VYDMNLVLLKLGHIWIPLEWVFDWFFTKNWNEINVFTIANDDYQHANCG
jgi:hypothetical protein